MPNDNEIHTPKFTKLLSRTTPLIIRFLLLRSKRFTPPAILEIVSIFPVEPE